MTFTALYKTYSNLVYNLCLHYLHNQQDAEEVTQDVFLKVHESMHKFEQRAELKTWIYRITVNRCLDFIKAQKRTKRGGIFSFLSISHSQAPEMPHFDHPGVLLENRLKGERIFNAIYNLPERQQTAIILQLTEGMTQIEIAEVMKTTPKSVDSLLSRARENLRKSLKSMRDE